MIAFLIIFVLRRECSFRPRSFWRCSCYAGECSSKTRSTLVYPGDRSINRPDKPSHYFVCNTSNLLFFSFFPSFFFSSLLFFFLFFFFSSSFCDIVLLAVYSYKLFEFVRSPFAVLNILPPPLFSFSSYCLSSLLFLLLLFSSFFLFFPIFCACLIFFSLNSTLRYSTLTCVLTNITHVRTYVFLVHMQTLGLV